MDQLKSGWKTTEFWLTLLAVLLGGFVNAGILPDAHIGIKVAGIALAALAALGYTASRGGLKAAATKAPVIKRVLNRTKPEDTP